MLPMLLDPENHNNYVWAYFAYSSERFKDLLSLVGFENRIHEKGSRNHPLSQLQQSAIPLGLKLELE